MQSTKQTGQLTNAAAPRAVERRQHSKEFKAEAVRLVKEGGRSFRDVAQSLALDIGLLRKWTKALEAQGTEAFRGHGQRRRGARMPFNCGERPRRGATPAARPPCATSCSRSGSRE